MKLALVLLALGVVLAASMPTSSSSPPEATVTTDSTDYAWFTPGPEFRPRVCMTFHNIGTNPLLLPSLAPWTIYDEHGHQTVGPLSIQAGVYLPPGDSYQSCVRMHSQESVHDAATHGPVWLALTQATLSPPAEYTAVWDYATLDGEPRQASAAFRLKEARIH